MDEKIKKLPQWVQSLLAEKKREIETLQAYVTAYKNQNLKSDISYNPRYQRDPVYLPEHTAVCFNTFITRNGIRIDAPIRVTLDDNKLKLYGNGCIVVLPQASNHVEIYNKED